MKRSMSHRPVTGARACVAALASLAIPFMARADGGSAGKAPMPAPSMQVGAADLRAVWDDPSFQKSFVAGYGVNPEVEPRISTDDMALLELVRQLMPEELKAAEALLRESVRNDSSAVIDLTLGGVQYQQDRPDEALANYRRAAEKYPNFRRAYRNIGLICVRKGLLDDAITAFNRMIELGGADAYSYGLLGYCHSQKQDFQPAEAAYRNALLLQPSNVEWRLGLTRTVFKQGKFEDAASLLDVLIQTFPEKADFWLLQAHTYLGLKEPQKAAVNLEALDAIGKSSVDSLYTLGDIYLSESLLDLAMQAYAIGTEFGGNGALAGSQLYRAVGETRYSIYRDLALFAEGGYDDQHYQGTTPFSIVAPIWGVGFRSQPDPDNFILFRYGQRNGYRSPYLQATWRVGTRTQVNASYSDTFSSAPLAQTGLLSTVGVDANGNLYDTLASAPILPVPVLTSLYASQSALMRRKLGWLSANQTWDRDTFIASLNYFDMIPLTSIVGTNSYYQRGYSFGLGWNRAFTPTLNGNVFFSVGWTDSTQQTNGVNSSAPNSGMNYSARVGLYNYFSETVIGSLNYTYYYNPNTTYGFGVPGQSIFIATIRKNF